MKPYRGPMHAQTTAAADRAFTAEKDSPRRGKLPGAGRRDGTPLTIGSTRRFATLSRSASSAEDIVFTSRFRAGDRGTVRPTGNRLTTQLPAGSGIRGAAGRSVFRAFDVTRPQVLTEAG